MQVIKLKAKDMGLKWYAVYTRPRWEKKVAEALTLIGIENYCPLNKVVRQWSDRRKIVQEPLFTSYVFVRINDKQYEQIRRVNGILNFVYSQGKPGVIKNEEIDLIRRFLNEYENVKVEKAMVNVNDMIKIASGPFIDMTGRVIEVINNSVSVLLPSLGCMLVTKANIRDIDNI